MFLSEHVERQKLIKPIEKPWEQKVAEWKTNEYKYECPLYLKGVGIIYPDFTFLSRKSGEEIYWENNGIFVGE